MRTFALFFAFTFTFIASGTFTPISTNTFTVADTFDIDIAVISAFVGTFVNMFGLNAWTTDQSSQNKNVGRTILSLISLPYFCWLPITLFFGGVIIQSVSTLQIAVLIELAIILFCLWLWHEGQRREANALNPFQGGLLEATLQRYANRAGMSVK